MANCGNSATRTKPEVKKKRTPKTADEVRKFPIPEGDHSIAEPAPILVTTKRLLKSGKPGDKCARDSRFTEVDRSNFTEYPATSIGIALPYSLRGYREPRYLLD